MNTSFISHGYISRVEMLGPIATLYLIFEEPPMVRGVQGQHY